MLNVPKGQVPDAAFSALSAYLIDRHYQKQGCDSWTVHRFQRLCGKLQRTAVEMAALMRIGPEALAFRLKHGFSAQDGLILTILEHEADQIHTGRRPEGLFQMVFLNEVAA